MWNAEVSFTNSVTTMRGFVELRNRFLKKNFLA